MKKGHSSIIAQFHAIQAIENASPLLHPSLQLVLAKYQEAFKLPHGLPPSHYEHGYNIPLILGNQPPNVCSYHHPFAQKNEIKYIIQELLDASVSRPSTNPCSSLIIMVLKNGAWSMCLDFRTLNKLTIKDEFPIPIIDDLLDELHGA